MGYVNREATSLYILGQDPASSSQIANRVAHSSSSRVLLCNMADEDFDPKGKGHLLALHILEKGFQTGSLIGGFFVVPFLTYKLGARNSQIVPRLANGLAISAITGTLLAGKYCSNVLRLERQWLRSGVNSS